MFVRLGFGNWLLLLVLVIGQPAVVRDMLAGEEPGRCAPPCGQHGSWVL
jgi:hypothetical protein